MSSLLAWPCAPAHATPTSAAERGERSSFLEVRLGLSKVAAERFNPQRFRRYLAIELDEIGHISARAEGPLGDHVAYLWIDVPDASTAVIQARLGGRSVGQRTIALREGLRVDVAARLVALAASEMLRAQVRRPRARRPQPPKPPSPAELDRRTRDNPAVLVAAEAAGAWSPSSRLLVGGPGLRVGFRFARVEQQLFAAWLGGTASGGTALWAEVGAGARYTLWLDPAWRIGAGARAAAASVRLHQASSMEGVEGERDAWTGRASADLAFEHALGPSLWLTLSLQPGVVLDPVRYANAEGAAQSLDGFWMAMQLGLTFDQRFARGAFTRLR